MTYINVCRIEKAGDSKIPWNYNDWMTKFFEATTFNFIISKIEGEDKYKGILLICNIMLKLLCEIFITSISIIICYDLIQVVKNPFNMTL